MAVYGVENSYSTALDLTNTLTYLGIKCISYSDVYLQKVSASNLTSRDTAVCISLSGASRDTVEAAKTAKQSGAKIIAVTNSESSPLCDYSDIVVKDYAHFLLTQKILMTNGVYQRPIQ
ncbi:MAG: SIS domain-containing protein [Clostridiales bacterium]|nr:SIS domain-containing protein [Clostridiales bacterium]